MLQWQGLVIEGTDGHATTVIGREGARPACYLKVTCWGDEDLVRACREQCRTLPNHHGSDRPSHASYCGAPGDDASLPTWARHTLRWLLTNKSYSKTLVVK